MLNILQYGRFLSFALLGEFCFKLFTLRWTKWAFMILFHSKNYSITLHNTEVMPFKALSFLSDYFRIFQILCPTKSFQKPIKWFSEGSTHEYLSPFVSGNFFLILHMKYCCNPEILNLICCLSELIDWVYIFRVNSNLWCSSQTTDVNIQADRVVQM